MELILASGSPRRRELLSRLGVAFTVIPAKGEEQITTDIPKEAVMQLAEQKAFEVFKSRGFGIVLGADTVVAFEDRILGKPEGEEEAFRMLSMLSGKTHSVYTGVAIVWEQDHKQQLHCFYQETKVLMYCLSESEIRSYIKTGEPLDKAGAYGIQGLGALLVEEICGDYYNVVGLPIAKLNQQMKKLGIEIFPDSYYDR